MGFPLNHFKDTIQQCYCPSLALISDPSRWVITLKSQSLSVIFLLALFKADVFGGDWVWMHKLTKCSLYTNDTIPGLLSHFLNIQSHPECYFSVVWRKSCLSGDFVGAISLTLERWGGVKARQQPRSRHTGVFLCVCWGCVYIWIVKRWDSSWILHCILKATDELLSV